MSGKPEMHVGLWPLQIDSLRVILYTVHKIILSYQANKTLAKKGLAKRIRKGRTMDKNNLAVITCMCSGMTIGLAIGGAAGLSHGRAGITMCYGLLFGTIIGVIIGTVIKKVKEKNNITRK